MKSSKVNTITSNEEQVRFEIFAGTLPIEGAGAQLLRIEKMQHDATRRQLAEARAEIDRLQAILNAPVLEPFFEAVDHEAKHQVYRWGEQHDATKTAWDWFWTLGYLGSKAAHAALARDWAKAKHHTITAAALLANWHKHICAHEAAEKETVKCA